ncbi:helix-turn-helix domain-containing protein [Photobacterium damselae]|uniref:helix-turn-helix domain-containing protein n=1 Tax=Photobacterium damselae TaxID=38293 RepID=UPI001E35CD53|nr:helix-turn-helix domain-containing protein [Photobacterium damselae]
MLRATKVRIYPTQEQADFLIAQFGAVRFAYNKALHLKSHMYRKHGVKLNPKKDIKPLLSVAKKSRKYHWLKQYDSIALQQSVINLHQAFDNFFNPKLKAKYPQFKRKHGKQSSYHCVGVKVMDGRFCLWKLRKTRYYRALANEIRSIARLGR